MKKIIIVTDNKELCEGLNRLNSDKEIIIRNPKSWSITKITERINREDKKISIEKIDNTYILTKCNPLNISAYHRTHRGYNDNFDMGCL